MRVLITNADGMDAHGLTVLVRIAHSLTDDVWTVAPEHEQSGTSRSLTLHAPVRVTEREPRRFAVRGTPTDCVRIAVLDLLCDHAPDLLLSGVNHGQNIGEDIALSGTVAAAVQGRSLGIPSIALSQAVPSFAHGTEVNWDAAEIFGPAVVRALVESDAAHQAVINVNFPGCKASAVRAVQVTVQGFHDRSCAHVSHCVDPRGVPHYWMCFHDIADEPTVGTDLSAIAHDCVSITPLQIDLTHHGLIEAIRKDLGVVRPEIGEAVLSAESGTRLALVRP